MNKKNTYIDTKVTTLLNIDPTLYGKMFHIA